MSATSRPSDFKVLLVYPNLSMMLTPAYSIGLFTAILKEQGYDVRLFDCTPYDTNLEFLGEPLAVTRARKLMNSRNFDTSIFGETKLDLTGDFRREIESYQPDAIIYSTVVEDTWPQLIELLEVSRDFDISHIVGGVFTMMAPNMAMQHPDVQCIGTGEGEEVIVEFCEAVRNGERPQNLRGTWARDDDGAIIKNPARPLVNINDTLPDYSLFDTNRFLRPLGAKIWKAVSLETYRGCPYTCSFCNSPTKNEITKEAGQGNYLRRKTMDTLRREIRMLIDTCGADFFYINDDAFMARPKSEILAFCEMYKEFSLPFWFQTRFENVELDLLLALKEVGCYRISFGVEHGNEAYRRDKLFRNITNQSMIDKAKLVAESGIPYTVNCLIGMPYETRELFMESVGLIRDIGSWDALSVNVFVPYHGTPLRTMALKEGWLDPTKQTTSVIAESLLEMPPPYLDGKEILGLQKTMPLYARFPEGRFDEIRRAEGEDDVSEALFEKLSQEWYDQTYGQAEEDRMLTYQG